MAPDQTPRPISLLVGAPAGSAADQWARGFVPYLERHWPRAAVTVLAQPGAGGLVAAWRVAESADGGVLGAVGTPLLLARAIERGEPALLGRLRFVAAVLEEPVLLVAAAGGPFATLAALRQPGEAARVATPASGSAAHLAAGLLAPALPLAPLAFANAAAARQAVLAGHLPCAMLGAPDAMAALRDGRLVALGLARAAPTAVLPGIPPLAERGVPASIAAWRGFAVSAAAPEAGLAGLRRALRAAVADPDYVAEAESAGQIAAFLDGPAWSAQLELLHRDLQARWTSTPWLIRR